MTGIIQPRPPLMKGLLFIERDGQVIEAEDVLSWAEWMEKGREPVGKTEVGGVTVSTIFLGAYVYGGLLYETMVFREGGPDLVSRYATRAEAEAGHAEKVQRLESTQP